MVGLYFGDVRHLCFLLLDVRRFERWSFWTALGVLSLALSLITGTLYVVLGLGPWSLVVLKDKIAVLGPGLGLECLVLDPGLELQVLGWVILSQQASSTMVWARGLRDLETQAQACVQQPCFVSEWTAHASKLSAHVQLSVGNFGLPEMQHRTNLRFMLQN